MRDRVSFLGVPPTFLGGHPTSWVGYMLMSSILLDLLVIISITNQLSNNLRVESNKTKDNQCLA